MITREFAIFCQAVCGICRHNLRRMSLFWLSCAFYMVLIEKKRMIEMSG